ncbi:uroporphyrin-III C-methyltransferase/precorrin-2 dehydrogenase/sirohydrochlorin ferrochelatase [Loktanella ponticola]|uniref:Uroporphyrin-III C-methyltransferase/precorrin-2 dehydrogenase/sirohydrochlorin ferrochelatase n=1 Tax=Yoonia ponticola TaxID=1524255 RepID=A0A7W9BK65_9RHOB|nr:siroheme synthase CysG [Yoonia ponticola]MBB5721772.1 uroporphyrin-III C-methyltransferase/precorrin-2 dehydrogenase/sirohydrochlorin ferrochelatase [Yoonia ponticola]
MDHFPVFMAVSGRRIVLSGGGDAAMAKLRLILKTTANVVVYADDAAAEIHSWAADGKLTFVARAMQTGDAVDTVLFYAANEDDVEDARVAAIAHAEGAQVNIVDNLHDSDFITPAIVDRDPVVVAIGTEGAAPVLARKIKADIEAQLPVSLGLLAKIGKTFRHAVDVLPMGGKRRSFWSEFYFNAGPKAVDAEGKSAVIPTLATLLDKHIMTTEKAGHVDLVGAGPGDPELLTLKARNALDKADVVIHDRLVTPEILELARREATIIDAGKTGFGPAMAQGDIDALIVEHALKGHHVVRLKAGDPTVFGRLDEEIDACDAAGISWRVVPGITAASAAVANIGQSLTKRDRNSSVRFITGHDTKGYADHDWRALAQNGEVAAIYMGKKSARFIQGRLLMHGANPATPVTIIENVSRTDQQIIATTLAELEPTLTRANLRGPAITFYGLAPRAALDVADTLPLEELA